MKQRLEELTKEDWDTLFPIELVPHHPAWKEIYEAERQKIMEALGEQTVLRIEHFGSTAIPGISAKPYIDIIVEIPKALLFNGEVIEKLSGLGYHYFRQTGGGADYMIFVKGYCLQGKSEQVFHIHMASEENILWHQLAFRDYLRANPARAKAYEELKKDLARTYQNDRSGYRIAKSDFIRKTLKMAKGKVRKS